MLLRLSACLAALLMLCTAEARAQNSTSAASAYIGADGCKSCHTAIYNAWATTKHAKALNRLSVAERNSGKCIGCHVTGSPEMIAADAGKPTHPNVQCEACHGAGRAHAEGAATTPPALAGMTHELSAEACTRCHNDRSPHFKGFSYVGMKWFVHKTQ